MAINIQNLIDAATAKTAVSAINAADSARLASLTELLTNHRNTQTFSNISELPTADSSNAGMIFRVASLVNGAYVDSGANYYVSYRDQWKTLNVTDSAVTEGQFAIGFQGENFGYTSGGEISPGNTNVIDKFSFSSDANATDVGDLTDARDRGAGQSSTVSGYTSGGVGTSPFTVIDKFPFSSDGNATDVGDLTNSAGNYVSGQSSETNGYTSGVNTNTSPSTRTDINKFPFASDGNATSVGSLVNDRYYTAGQSSPTHGYASGGYDPTVSPIFLTVVEKFPFASDGNSSEVGNLSLARYGAAGQNSATHGYTSGGRDPVTNVIDKFPFASDGTATDVGDLTVARHSVAGQSSTASGYTSGGNTPPATPFQNIIDKFPFSSDANASDVGDLTLARREVAGQQY